MADFEPRDLVTTREAAAILGVGTTSIKRWADRGQLTCVRTAGGHRRFSRAAVLAFQRLGADEGRGDSAADPEWVGAWIERLAGDSAAGEIEAALSRERERLGSWAAVSDALGGVLDEVGRRWATGDLTVVEEHVAAARLSRAMGDVAGSEVSSNSPRAALVAAQGDDHCLGLSLCEPVLREAGWRPLWIGARAPIGELCGFIARRGPELVLMSASAYSTDGAALAGQAERIGEACRRAGSALIVGGRGHWPEPLAQGRRLHRFGDLAALLARH